MFPNLDRVGGQALFFSFISTLAMEDERRVKLDRLVMQYELLYDLLGQKKAMHDLELIDLERKIRECAAACNDPATEFAQVVNGLWFFWAQR